jgi:dihydroorotase
MIIIKNVKTGDGRIEDKHIPSTQEQTIDGTGKLLIPGVVDPHVHFRVPGAEHKEDWKTGALAAIAGGVTTVLDMPNNSPSITSLELLNNKKTRINDQLHDVQIPLHYGLYLGATDSNLDEIRRTKDSICAIKMFMGASTGSLLVDKQENQEEIFKLAAELDLVVGVHAEHEHTLQENMKKHVGNTNPAIHSAIRERAAAKRAAQAAIAMSRKYGTKLYILHASTKEEVELVRAAKKEGLPVYAETTPHHLFLCQDDYEALGTKGQMNPPLRTTYDQEALWRGIEDGTIDTIGSDHAPHTLDEKDRGYGQAPSGVPGVETLLPLIANRYLQGKISFKKLVEITSGNASRIFKLEQTNDWVLVDTEHARMTRDENMKTKCGWTPYSGMELTGWPTHTIINGNIFDLT